MALWLVRSGKEGEHEDKFLSENRIYLTWGNLSENLSKISEKREIYELLKKLYPDSKTATLRNWTGQIWRFAKEMKIDDWIVSPSKHKPTIHIGKITGDYVNTPNNKNPYYHYRTVEWLAIDIPKTNFEQEVLDSFLTSMTICRIDRNDIERRIKEMAANNWKMLESNNIRNESNNNKTDSFIKNYWLFQSNPKIWKNIKEQLINGQIKEWKVTRYTKQIKKGDKIIIWITGRESGVYALGEAVSEPLNKKVKIKITHNIAQNPILGRTKDLFKYTKNGQGSNFKSHKYDFENILNQIEKRGLSNKTYKNKGIFKNSPNIIFYGPPGTGKTYRTIAEAVRIINPEFYEENKNNRGVLREEFKKLKNNGQIEFITFHQSYSYEEFVEGIKPVLNSGENNINYVVEDGVFKRICNKARIKNENNFETAYNSLLKEIKEKDNEILILSTIKTGRKFGISINRNGNLNLFTGDKLTLQGTLTKENILKQLLGINTFEGWEGYFWGVINHLKEKHDFKVDINKEEKRYVLIIDEINRGNISKIFGELITLIEQDKRISGREELMVKLPYSKENFGVPKNLYIIGTMNTADRSIALMDIALRRRFEFIEMMPDFSMFDSEQYKGEDLKKAIDIMKTLNRKISIVLDKDHQLGQSFLFKAIENGEFKKDKFVEVFKREIIPTLCEYFYEDWDRLRIVLGGKIIEEDKDGSELLKSNDGIKDYTTDNTIYKINLNFSFDDIYESIINNNNEK